MNRTLSLVITIALSLFATLGYAQSSPSGDSKEPSSETQPSGSTGTLGSGELKLTSPFATASPSDSDDEEGEEEESDDDSSQTEPAEEEAVTVVEAAPSSASESPVVALDVEEEEFEPLEDIEEGALEQILPGKVHPRLEFKGYFRARVDMPVNYDLDTEGTSSILPVLDSVGTLPPDKDKSVSISTNMRLHLEPTLFITEELRVHGEFDLLDNVVFGNAPERRALPSALRPEFNRPLQTSKQFSLAESFKINELYGVVDSLFGSLYVGRMDNNFGLGIQDNSGDCIDCDYGTNSDSIKVETRAFGITASASIDFPDEGISTQTFSGTGGQGYDLAQVDDVDQYTFRLDYAPRSQRDRILEQRTLQHEGLPIYNAALLFRWRTQDGAYLSEPQATQNFPTVLPTLIYKGLSTYTLDAWFKFLYNPNDDLKIRLEFETFVNFGKIDNISNQPVGQATSTQTAEDCFKGGSTKERCTRAIDGTSLARQFVQYGFALESEFQFGQIASWGLNLGLASGGDSPNWGYGNTLPDYSFAHFNRDYHVDLILFRNVIGTVTNAAYFKPYVHLEFLKSGNRHIEADINAILSLAVNKKGTPSGQRWLGTEFDAAIRYILKNQLSAGFEAGVLFPFSGLNAVLGRPRLQRFNSNGAVFTENKTAGIAWTLQGKLTWMF